jgi:hypothetical protein
VFSTDKIITKRFSLGATFTSFIRFAKLKTKWINFCEAPRKPGDPGKASPPGAGGLRGNQHALTEY